jgi:hypothetical protein
MYLLVWLLNLSSGKKALDYYDVRNTDLDYNLENIYIRKSF